MYFGVVYVYVVFNDDVAARVAQDQVCSSCPGLWPVAVALRREGGIKSSSQYSVQSQMLSETSCKSHPLIKCRAKTTA